MASTDGRPRSAQIGMSGQRAALKGANLAFRHTLAAKPKKKPPARPSQATGALVAATAVASPAIARTTTRASARTLGSTGNNQGHGHLQGQHVKSPRRSSAVHHYNGANRSRGPGTFNAPVPSAVDAKSPSLIAATVAASRSASPTPSSAGTSGTSHQAQPPVRLLKKSDLGRQDVTSSAILALEPHETNPLLQPTSAVISMFEHMENNVDPVKRSTQTSLTLREKSPARLLPPFPKKAALTPESAVSQDASSEILSPFFPIPELPPGSLPSPGIYRPSDSFPLESKCTTKAAEPQPGHDKQYLAQAKMADTRPMLAPGLDVVISKPQVAVSHVVASEQNLLSVPTSPSLGARNGPPRLASETSTSSDDTFVSSSSHQSPTRNRSRTSPIKSPPPRSPSRPPGALAPSRRTSPSRPTTPGRARAGENLSVTLLSGTASASASSLTLPSLADAMVASSLASTRAATEVPRAISPATAAVVGKDSNKHKHSISSSIQHHVRRHHSGPKGTTASGSGFPLLKYQHSGNSTASLPLGLPASSPMQQQQRNMPLTLRAYRTAEEDKREEKKQKRKAKGSKRHAHHEGTRRRWRDEISTEERKRYEALWASNRGLLVEYLWPPIGVVTSAGTGTVAPGTSETTGRVSGGGIGGFGAVALRPSGEDVTLLDDDGSLAMITLHAANGHVGRLTPHPLPTTASFAQVSATTATTGDRAAAVGSAFGPGEPSPSFLPPEPQDCVLNVVVRDLWQRSRLPEDELAEVWELVDRSRRGMLDKQEFVVGMWVIDQRLKGRKIPTRIQETMWDSARGVLAGKK